MKRFHQYLINIFHIHEKKSQLVFRELGLSKGQPKMIEILSHQEGCSQKELAKSCSIEPATVTSLLNKMIDKDLVYKKPLLQENGIRIQQIFLTEKGHNIADGVQSIVNEMEQVSFQGFSQEEKEQCLSFLDRIFENLQNHS
ncbi:MAG: MarR family transcriptional regulator [Eubacterium sp.]|jgi:Transcriptional regulators|nr:MarR family transcriptional regulator [Eubacterium sp.]